MPDPTLAQERRDGAPELVDGRLQSRGPAWRGFAEQPLDPSPSHLDRVQLRAVRREILNRRAKLGERLLDARDAVDPRPIQDNDVSRLERRTKVVAKEVDEDGASYVAFNSTENPNAVQRYGADQRDVLTPSRALNDRRLSRRSPPIVALA